MDGQQLEYCLKTDRYTEHIFRGIFAADILPKRIKDLPCGFIANTDPSHKPGEHWVAFYIDANGNAEYFDSYGVQPKLKHFKNFLEQNSISDYHWNSCPLQGPFSSVCGQYCLF